MTIDIEPDVIVLRNEDRLMFVNGVQYFTEDYFGRAKVEALLKAERRKALLEAAEMVCNAFGMTFRESERGKLVGDELKRMAGEEE